MGVWNVDRCEENSELPADEESAREQAELETEAVQSVLYSLINGEFRLNTVLHLLCYSRPLY